MSEQDRLSKRAWSDLLEEKLGGRGFGNFSNWGIQTFEAMTIDKLVPHSRKPTSPTRLLTPVPTRRSYRERLTVDIRCIIAHHDYWMFGIVKVDLAADLTGATEVVHWKIHTRGA